MAHSTQGVVICGCSCGREGRCWLREVVMYGSILFSSCGGILLGCCLQIVMMSGCSCGGVGCALRRVVMYGSKFGGVWVGCWLRGVVMCGCN